ncbi:latent-transforming growth factor beta-binding protein 2-like isoform X2 [Mercenaria mercenaria]|uniref:latent-transforming growth factor beta-binding protein 2-like isoform X2 n=1 Tax=Mercenaria mercenaria TaxID=6596 RepID=UPI00234EE203|nr:latent-transforming growth factor beta-binding protein 2-like isoform X2 [Mercenaria mercenaria]
MLRNMNERKIALYWNSIFYFMIILLVLTSVRTTAIRDIDDIDECKYKDSYICNFGTCHNYKGGWNCTCGDGYYPQEIVPNKIYQCVDIDECAENKIDCSGHGNCKNVPGGYTCVCDTGFNFNETNKSCEDIDECTENEIDCSGHGNCKNVQGDYTCVCDAGFIFNETNKSCEDIDECQSPKYTCGGEGKCFNTDGKWTCSCPDFGYRRHVYSEDVIVCEDIDECSDSYFYCGGTCNNTQGNWTCECDKGYTRDSNNEATIITCEDINECELQESCIGGVCNNLDGSWTCICPEGKEPKTINSTTILCSGGYVYTATIGITVTGPAENKDHELKVYLETQIKNAYESQYPEQNVRVEIISISKDSTDRKKRQTSENLAVEFVLHFDEPLDSVNITTAWQDYRKESCPKGICKSEKNDISVDLPFNVIFEEDVVFEENKQTDGLCSIPQNNLCNPDSTKCQYIHATLNCECKKGYTRKSDYECKVSKNTCNENPCQNYGSCHMIDEDTDFECRCRDGWTGKTCEVVQLAETDFKTTMYIICGTLGGTAVICIFIIIGICRKRLPQIKNTPSRTNSAGHPISNTVSNVLDIPMSNQPQGQKAGRSKGAPQRGKTNKRNAEKGRGVQSNSYRYGQRADLTDYNISHLTRDEHQYETIRDDHIYETLHTYANM